MHAKALGLLAAAGLAVAAPPVYPTTTTPAPPPTTTPPPPPSTATPPPYSKKTTETSSWKGTSTWSSATSSVTGKAFDRIMMIYLETTSFENATAEPNCETIYNQGILLTEHYGIGDPSQPNYVAPASGDDFGTNSDSFLQVAANVSTVVDLLDAGGVSWADYNEGLPYSGFNGYNYTNLTPGVDNGTYVRKHNLLQRFESIQNNATRESLLKNFTLFYEDLDNKVLPQWIFITPNLYNNGHDTNVTVSCNWTRSFIEPLLKNEYFNNNTLIYITWQANGDNPVARNHVAGIQVGSAVPSDLIGTQDSSYYNHYSEIASVEANWGLHTLGRWDVGANVWKWVGAKTGDVIRTWNRKVYGAFDSYYWNQSYGGVFSSAKNTSHLYVAPNTGLVQNGRTVLQSIVDLWSGSTLPDYYKNIIELPDEFHPPKGYAVPIGLDPPEPITTPITVYPSSLRSNTNPTSSA